MQYLQIRQMAFLRYPSHPHVCRMASSRPSQGETYYLRSILSIRPGESYEDLRTFNGNIYATYQETAQAMGIFDDERECVVAFEDCCFTALVEGPSSWILQL